MALCFSFDQPYYVALCFSFDQPYCVALCFDWLIMGKSGSCNNLKTTCSFLMKLATWIDSKEEIMHILLICLPSINCGCYGNLKLSLV